MATELPKVAQQRIYKAHAAYAAEKPEWMQLALTAVNAWGRQEATLTQAIAEALEAAYAAGVAGEYPEYAKPASYAPIRRTRPVQEVTPEPTAHRVGRARPTPQVRTITRRRV